MLIKEFFDKNRIPIFIVLLGIIFRVYVIYHNALPHFDSFLTLKKVTLNYKAGNARNDVENTWEKGEDLARKSYTLEAGKLDYQKLNHQLKRGNHPPFYYYIFHSVKAISDGQNPSLTSGYVLNLVLWILSIIIFYKLLNLLFENKRLIYLCLLIYSLSFGTFTTIILLKAYVLQELLIISLVYLFVLQSKKTILNLLDYFVFGLVCVLAFLTHYFSYPIIAILGVTIAVYLLFFTKQSNRLMGYVITILGAVGVALVLYPNAINNILGDSRSIEIQEELRNPISVSTLKSSFELLKQYVLTWPIIVMIAIGLLSRIFIKNEESNRSDLQALIILLSCFSTILFFSLLQFAPYSSIRYVSSILPLLIVGAILLTKWLIIRNHILYIVFIIGVTAYPMIQLIRVDLKQIGSSAVIQYWGTNNLISRLDKEENLLVINSKSISYMPVLTYYSSNHDLAFSGTVLNEKLLSQRKRVTVLIHNNVGSKKIKTIVQRLKTMGYIKKKGRFKKFLVFQQ